MVFPPRLAVAPRLASVRDPDHEMQTPTTVTGLSDVCVTPDTNRAGGIESTPTSSTCSHGSLDQSTNHVRATGSTHSTLPTNYSVANLRSGSPGGAVPD